MPRSETFGGAQERTHSCLFAKFCGQVRKINMNSYNNGSLYYFVQPLHIMSLVEHCGEMWKLNRRQIILGIPLSLTNAKPKIFFIVNSQGKNLFHWHTDIYDSIRWQVSLPLFTGMGNPVYCVSKRCQRCKKWHMLWHISSTTVTC